jgi:hypothetical protein
MFVNKYWVRLGACERIVYGLTIGNSPAGYGVNGKALVPITSDLLEMARILIGHIEYRSSL